MSNPEIRFLIHPETGEFEWEVNGVRGNKCEDIEKVLAENVKVLDKKLTSDWCLPLPAVDRINVGTK